MGGFLYIFVLLKNRNVNEEIIRSNSTILINDIRCFLGKNDSIQSKIKMCRLSFFCPTTPYR